LTRHGGIARAAALLLLGLSPGAALLMPNGIWSPGDASSFRGARYALPSQGSLNIGSAEILSRVFQFQLFAVLGAGRWPFGLEPPSRAFASEDVYSSIAVFPVPLGLPPIPWPEDNPYSPARAELGELLFFDGRLSANGTVSCAFCHEPARAFSGSTPDSKGVNNERGSRHAPSLINRAWGKSQFWDGRAPTLEAQVIIPVTNANEMGMTADRVVNEIRSIEGYRPLFAKAFGDSTINFERIAKAIATFERTIVSGNSAYDRYIAGDKSALTKEQKDGLDFFNKKGECAECHNGPNFSNEKFANLGVGSDREHPDPGREDVTKKRGDLGKFKVPTLRDLAHRAPYMHDGSIKTLNEVLNIYAKGGLPNPHLDTRLTPFYLDEQTRRDLLAFLDSLNGEGWKKISPPIQFPN
jgi:cytochrome c peroxidase